MPRRIAPDYAAASCTPRPPRRLLLTEPAAPSPPLPCDAPSLAARAAVPPSASHRLPTPARRCSCCHRGSRETRPLLPIPHPCPARPPSLSSGKRATRSRLLANRRPAPVRAPRTRESVPAASSRRSRRDVLPVGAALLSPARSLFPFSMPLSSTLCTASYTPCPCTNIPPIISTVFFDPHSHGRDPIDSFLTVPSYFPP